MNRHGKFPRPVSTQRMQDAVSRLRLTGFQDVAVDLHGLIGSLPWLAALMSPRWPCWQNLRGSRNFFKAQLITNTLHDNKI